MINKIALYKAMRFIFIPTLTVFMLLLVGFWSFTDLFSFLISTSYSAVLVRILLFIAECVLIVIMYFKYESEEALKNIAKSPLGSEITNGRYDRYVYMFFKNDTSSSSTVFTSYATEDSDIIIIKRVN